MGCLSSRRIPEEEKELLQAERKLGFSSVSAEDIEAALKLWSVPSGLTPKRLEKALESLHIPYPGNSVSLSRLYKRFLASDRYDAQRLLLFAVLLSAGPLQRKLEIWFDNLDTDLTGYLSKEQFQRLVRLCLDVNSLILPEFATESEKMLLYVKEWRPIADDFVTNVTTLMYSRSERISRAQFLKNMSGEFVKLTYCAGIRELLQEFYVQCLATHSVHPA